MATIYRTDDTVEEVEPRNGTDFSLEEMQKIVGGFIEVFLLKENRFMIVNEEGKLFYLPLNKNATLLYGNLNDVIVGDALVCSRDQIK
jgi:hypothetical protein